MATKDDDDHELPGHSGRPHTIDTIIWQRISEVARDIAHLRSGVEAIQSRPNFGPEERALLYKLSRDWEARKDALDKLPDMLKAYERRKWLRGLFWQVVVGAALVVPGVMAAREPIMWFVGRLLR